MSSEGTRNVLMYFGAMGVVSTFWLLLLGLVNHSPLQLTGAAAALIVTVFCFRAYRAELRKDSQPPNG